MHFASLLMIIDKDHLPSLMTALASVDDWFTLGLILGVECDTLERIRSDNKDHCKLDMLVAWLRSAETCTKHQLSLALR